jgi:DMSO/TMAO reductase YedYZ molybdopterin-dependent catalytic subunit
VWPEITSKDVMLAYEQDGEAIRNGVRLVLTGDGLAFRSLGGVVSIEPRAVEPVAPATGGGVELRGLLDRPGVIDAAVLAAFEPIEVTTVDATGHGGQSVPPRNYAGVRLYALLEAAGIRSNPEVNEDFMNKVIVATSTDGHAVVIAGGEIEPRFQNGDVILATQHEGSALPVDEGLRLIVPFDRKPGRWAKDLVSIELREG